MDKILIKKVKNLSQDTWSKIAKIDEIKGAWFAGAKLNTQVLSRLKKSVLVTSTGASTRIEGALLSDKDIESLMRGVSIQRFKDRDKQEVQGYYELLQNVFNSWKSVRFSEGTVKHFHKELLKYVAKDEMHRGSYKRTENKVEMIDQEGQSIGVLFDTTSAYLTPKEMQELIEFTQDAFKKKEYHPLVIIGNFLVEFLNIHPFQDGNGRLSRILTNLLLLQSGYLYMPYVSHERLVEQNKAEYYMALRKSQKTLRTDKPNINAWLNFFLTLILEQSEDAIKLISEESVDKLLSPKQMTVWQYLQTVDIVSPQDIASATEVSRPTVNQVLRKLLDLKKIERLGQGRTTRYRKLS